MKKGAIWISAVLYMGMGVVILTIILAAGMPVINKMKDKNVAVQTQEVMFKLDRNIRAVYTEGPGSQRPIKVEIKKGSLRISQELETIDWNFRSKVLLSEPNTKIKQGNLEMYTIKESKGRYMTTFTLNYTDILNITSDLSSLSGTNNIIVTNLAQTELPEIQLSSI